MTVTSKIQTPIAPRIRDIIADGLWYSRSQLATALKRSYGLSPADVKALNRMIADGEIEASYERTQGMNGRWIYRKAQS